MDFFLKKIEVIKIKENFWVDAFHQKTYSVTLSKLVLEMGLLFSRGWVFIRYSGSAWL